MKRKKNIKKTHKTQQTTKDPKQTKLSFFLLSVLIGQEVHCIIDYSSPTNFSYSEPNNCTYLCQQVTILHCGVVLQESMHAIISQRIVNTAVLTLWY